MGWRRSGNASTMARVTPLGTYLTDHEAGAASGRALVRRLLRANEKTSYAEDYRPMVEQIDEDAAALHDIRKRLGIGARPWKRLSGPITAVAGRLHGLPGSYTALHRLREIEALAAGVATKRSLWSSLRAADLAQLDRTELDRLIGRADDQHATLMRHRDRSAVEAFGAST